MRDQEAPSARAETTRSLYSRRQRAYHAFVTFFRSQRGLQRALEASAPLKPSMKVLDAGCGSGLATFAVVAALRSKGLDYGRIDGFDLTPAMLSRFQEKIADSGLERIRVQQADVLALDALPGSWSGYDLIVSTSMLEYVSKHELPQALAGLRSRLAPAGRILIMITRRTIEAKLLVEWAWHANRYSRNELSAALGQAGFRSFDFLRFPLHFGWLNRANHLVLADR